VFTACDLGAEHESCAQARGAVNAMAQNLAKELGNDLQQYQSQEQFQADPYVTPTSSPIRSTFDGHDDDKQAPGGSKPVAVGRGKTSALSAKDRAKKLEAKRKMRTGRRR
jgi:hypothetical protein